MRNRAWVSGILVLAFVLGAGGCRKYVTRPIYRRPVISSVVAFPTVLSQGDSTLITVFATDPDGDSLVYDWVAFNGLLIKDGPGYNYLYNTPSGSRIFYRSSTGPSANDTAFVWCSVRDQRGGSDSRQILIFFQN
jgi:hypothetical protein